MTNLTLNKLQKWFKPYIKNIYKYVQLIKRLYLITLKIINYKNYSIYSFTKIVYNQVFYIDAP